MLVPYLARLSYGSEFIWNTQATFRLSDVKLPRKTTLLDCGSRLSPSPQQERLVCFQTSPCRRSRRDPMLLLRILKVSRVCMALASGSNLLFSGIAMLRALDLVNQWYPCSGT